MSKVVELQDNTFTKEVKLSEKPVVLVDFYATWCGPCQMMHPIVDELSEEFDYVKVCRINVDEAPRMAARYGVISVPTFLVFHNGQIVNMQIGMLSKDELKNMIM